MGEIVRKNQAFSVQRRILVGLVLVVVVGAVWFLVKSYYWPKEIRHIVLISIDTCRADYLGRYSYLHKISPNIDAVADEAVVFNHVLTPVPLTLPAHCSMLTGTIPPYHGVHHNVGYRLDESNITIAEILREKGYTTGAIISSFVLDAQFGTDQGFDTYNDHFVQPIESLFHNERRGGEATHFACEWLEEHQNEPFFLFLHYFDPHYPYIPPEPFATTFRYNVYAGEIAYTDYCIGQVIKKLKDLGLYDSTLLIITADHGEGLREHSESTHGYFIYHSTMHVPLIVKVPGGPEGKKVDEVVGLVDIVPTICGVLGITPPSTMHGTDLSGFFKKKGEIEKNERYIYCESLIPTQHGCSSLLGVVNDRWKYIQAPRPELYNLDKDPQEIENLFAKHPKRARLLQNRLKLTLQEQMRTSQTDKKFVLDKESKRRLESLGYVGGGLSEDFEFDSTKDDPKDSIRLHEQVVTVCRFLKTEQYSKAEAICSEILAERPEYLLHFFLLAKIARGRNNIEESITHFSKFLSQVDDANNRYPGDKSPQHLVHFVSDAHNDLGMIFSERRDFNQAIKHYTRALELNPDFPELYYNLGNVFFKQNKLDEAIRHHTRALELNPDFHEVYHNLGNVFFRQNKLDEAVKHYTKTLELVPELPEAHYSLGNALLKQGKFEKAIARYNKAIMLRPDWDDARNDLQIAQSRKSQIERIAFWNESLRENPNQPRLHNILGTIFHRQGDVEKAIYHWKKTLELKPDWPDVLNNLACLLAAKENTEFSEPDEAIRLAKRACELTEFKRPQFLSTLAVAYAAAGRFDEAVETAEKTLELAESANQKQLAEAIKKRLELYKSGQR